MAFAICMATSSLYGWLLVDFLYSYASCQFHLFHPLSSIAHADFTHPYIHTCARLLLDASKTLNSNAHHLDLLEHRTYYDLIHGQL